MVENIVSIRGTVQARSFPQQMTTGFQIETSFRVLEPIYDKIDVVKIGEKILGIYLHHDTIISSTERSGGVVLFGEAYLILPVSSESAPQILESLIPYLCNGLSKNEADLLVTEEAVDLTSPSEMGTRIAIGRNQEMQFVVFE